MQTVNNGTFKYPITVIGRMSGCLVSIPISLEPNTSLDVKAAGFFQECARARYHRNTWPNRRDQLLPNPFGQLIRD